MTFLELYSVQDRLVFKCVKPVIPRAKNAIFNEVDNTGHLVYSNIEQDPKRPDYEQGHVQSAPGDSGSPLWKESDFSATQKRATLVAVQHAIIRNLRTSGGSSTASSYLNDPYLQCRNFVTKITHQMKQWFFSKEKEAFEN